MDPKTNWSKGQTFKDVDAGIEAAGRTIGKNYREAGGDVDKMAKKYAPPGAANDPGGLNRSWPSGVAAAQKSLATKASVNPQVASTDPSSGVPQPPAPGTGAATGIGGSVDDAMKMLGLNESSHRQILSDYMKTGGRSLSGEQNAWCAAFVNGVVQHAGMPGTGSWAAKSFLNWGKSVGASDALLKGDVFVFDRGRDPSKGHVGIHTGKTRVNAQGQTEYEMLQGNTGGAKAGGGAVGTTWHTRQSIKSIRRGTPPQGQAAPSPVAGPPTGASPTGTTATPWGEDRQYDVPVQMNVKVNDNDMQFARSTLRRSADREVREARWSSYSDIGAA